MPLDPNTLDGLLASDVALAALPDDRAADALSAPTLTPRPERITYTTLGAVWTPAAAAVFTARLTGAAAAGNPLALYVDKLLSGPGFDVSDPETKPSADQLVAAGLCSAEQATSVLYLPPVYRAGGVVTAADVTASRLRIARASACQSLRERMGRASVAAAQLVAAAEADPSLPLPGWDQIAAAFASGGGE